MIRVNSINELYFLKFIGTYSVILFLFFECHSKELLMPLCNYFLSVICSTFLINTIKIIFKWSLPLTPMKFFTSSSFFNASVAIFLFSSSFVTSLAPNFFSLQMITFVWRLLETKSIVVLELGLKYV